MRACRRAATSSIRAVVLLRMDGNGRHVGSPEDTVLLLVRDGEMSALGQIYDHRQIRHGLAPAKENGGLGQGEPIRAVRGCGAGRGSLPRPVEESSGDQRKDENHETGLDFARCRHVAPGYLGRKGDGDRVVVGLPHDIAVEVDRPRSFSSHDGGVGGGRDGQVLAIDAEGRRKQNAHVDVAGAGRGVGRKRVPPHLVLAPPLPECLPNGISNADGKRLLARRIRPAQAKRRRVGAAERVDLGVGTVDLNVANLVGIGAEGAERVGEGACLQLVRDGLLDVVAAVGGDADRDVEIGNLIPFFSGLLRHCRSSTSDD